MNHMKKTALVLSLFAAFSQLGCIASEHILTSPDNRTRVVIRDGAYSVSRDGEMLVRDAKAALILADGSIIGLNGKEKARYGKTVTEHISAPFYRQSSFDFTYNSLRLDLRNGFAMEWKVSDEGVAYRFVCDRKEGADIADETVELNFEGEGKAWLPYSTNPGKPQAMAFQNRYTVQKISDGFPKQPRPMVRHDGTAPVYPDMLAFLPATVESGSKKVTVLESGVESYPGMFVKPLHGTNTLKGEFARIPKTYGCYSGRVQKFVDETLDIIASHDAPVSYPWRILAISDEDRMMPVNNLVYALARPNCIGDTSWIRPGFSAWEWWNDWQLTGVDFKAGINMDTYRHYIDFASANGIEYLVLDEGWYVPASGDMLTPIKELDIPGLVAYAGEKGVKILLWCVFNVLDDSLEEACRKYSEMGVAGFKVDFLDRDDQKAQEMCCRIAETAAKYRLVLDYHGISKPVGLNRTYPNILNYEAIFGQEEVRWSDADVDIPLYDVTAPFIRMMAGYTDYTPGAMRNAAKADFKAIYNHPMSMGTRAHQVALYIVYDSPLTMLCDSPSLYEAERETLDYICSLPRIYDSETVLDGKLGEYVVIARREGDGWYVGGLTSWEGRETVLDMSFLGEGVWQVELFRDGVNADRDATDFSIERFNVTGEDKITVRMASGGGFAMIITQ